MKQLTIIGNLGANAVQRTTTDGKQIMSFNVAVNGGNDTTIWFNCVGNYREKVFPYLIKGQCVCVTGDLRAGMYNNNIDLTVSVDRCELCGRAPEKSSQQSADQESAMSELAREIPDVY